MIRQFRRKLTCTALLTLTQEQYDSLAESLEENQALRQWLTEGRIDQEIYDALVKAMTADKEI